VQREVGEDLALTRQFGGAAKTLLDQAKNDAATQAKASSAALADAIESKLATTNSRVDAVASDTRIAQWKIDQNAQALEKLKGLTPEQITALLATLGVSVGGQQARQESCAGYRRQDAAGQRVDTSETQHGRVCDAKHRCYA
jgi:hypothetical protein